MHREQPGGREPGPPPSPRGEQQVAERTPHRHEHRLRQAEDAEGAAAEPQGAAQEVGEGRRVAPVSRIQHHDPSPGGLLRVPGPVRLVAGGRREPGQARQPQRQGQPEEEQGRQPVATPERRPAGSSPDRIVAGRRVARGRGFPVGHVLLARPPCRGTGSIAQPSRPFEIRGGFCWGSALSWWRPASAPVAWLPCSPSPGPAELGGWCRPVGRHPPDRLPPGRHPPGSGTRQQAAGNRWRVRCRGFSGSRAPGCRRPATSSRARCSSPRPGRCPSGGIPDRGSAPASVAGAVGPRSGQV